MSAKAASKLLKVMQKAPEQPDVECEPDAPLLWHGDAADVSSAPVAVVPKAQCIVHSPKAISQARSVAPATQRHAVRLLAALVAFTGKRSGTICKLSTGTRVY